MLGLLVTEAAQAGDGWGLQTLPGNNMGEIAVRAMGSPEQIDKWADGIRRGEFQKTAIAMTEKHCGLDLSQIKTTAVKKGDHWVLNGSKHWISHAATADFLIVLAQTQPGSGMAGARPFIVSRKDEGLIVTIERLEKMGTRNLSQAAIEFRDIMLPEDRLLDSGTLMDFLTVLAGTRPFCAATAIGTASTMLNYSEKWLNEHDRPWSLRRRERVKEVVEEARGALDKARRMVLRAGWVHDQGRADNVLSQKAKGYSAPITQGVALKAMQLMGPEAWSKDHLMEKWYRDVKFVDLVDGTRNLHRLTVARAEFGGGVR
ncbi:hypothetical protein C1T17_17940 [Sphingobium sp. SCG-1]|uniref:acyl-CoA dehydrogenase family protein n=1 Tax=Sphingobium sp. SCG-1 TaxID=2072936 RepID=UPI000CD68274|nr:acyl-CoA dehydrogenase [Sphingobium sp. SCG-1]AUW59686.1 hypothetical protein C1T17_17940 [Sphingobium sp. SCG-1]